MSLSSTSFHQYFKIIDEKIFVKIIDLLDHMMNLTSNLVSVTSKREACKCKNGYYKIGPIDNYVPFYCSK